MTDPLLMSQMSDAAAPDRALANQLGAMALTIADRLHRAASDAVGFAGETPAALALIGLEPGLSNDALRRILNLSHPGAVRLVDRLAVAGLVERRAARDARAVALHLTDAGVKARQRLLNSREAVLGKIVASLSGKDRKTLAGIVHRMLAPLPDAIEQPYRICRMCNDQVCDDCPFDMDAAGTE